MKQISFYILVVLLVGCSRFDNGDSILPAQIDSDLPIINITVDESEFNEMFENTDEEIKEATINMNNLLDNKLDLKFINKEQAQFWNIYMNNIKFDTKELIICPTFFKKNLSLFQ